MKQQIQLLSQSAVTTQHTRAGPLHDCATVAYVTDENLILLHYTYCSCCTAFVGLVCACLLSHPAGVDIRECLLCRNKLAISINYL
jgi:hypothetical protein